MTMHLLSGLVVVASATLLIGLTVLVFAKPVVAERFFLSFASSAQAHFVEQILRVLLGGSLVIYSSSMWQPHTFRLIEWAIVVSSVGLMLIPWQWHHRFGKKVLPALNSTLEAVCNRHVRVRSGYSLRRVRCSTQRRGISASCSRPLARALTAEGGGITYLSAEWAVRLSRTPCVCLFSLNDARALAYNGFL